MPAAVAALDLEATIAAELAAHRPELEQLVRQRVRFALAELTRELVAQVERSTSCPESEALVLQLQEF